MVKIPPDQEKELLVNLKSGDHAAFNALYQLYERKIYYNLKRLVHLPEIAAELHQDVFIRVWNKRAYLDPDLSFEGFLIHIANNAVVDFYRKAARDKKLIEQLALSMTELHDPIFDLLNLKATNEALETAINKLPAQRRLVFIRIKQENKTYENTASYFGVSIGTIKDHMAKAIRFLRAELNNPKLFILPLLIFKVINDWISNRF